MRPRQCPAASGSAGPGREGFYPAALFRGVKTAFLAKKRGSDALVALVKSWGQAVGEQEGVGEVVVSAAAGFGVSLLTCEGLWGRVCEERPKGCGGVSGPAVMDGDAECSKGNARLVSI